MWNNMQNINSETMLEIIEYFMCEFMSITCYLSGEPTLGKMFMPGIEHGILGIAL